MKRHTLIWIGIASLAFLTVDRSFGITIPAGSLLVVRTLHGISSIDAPGTRFPAELAKDVVVNGKAVLPVGTKVSGQIATSKRTHTSSQRLTVDFTDESAFRSCDLPGDLCAHRQDGLSVNDNVFGK